MNGILSAGSFLFSLFFSVLTFILWVRIAVRYFYVSTLHPISQVIYRLTDPLVSPLNRLIKIPNTRKNRYDWPCFILLVAVEVIKFLLISLLFFKTMFPVIWLILYPLADLIVQPLNLLFYAILFRVIMSWINPTWQHPIYELMMIVTEPSLRIARRYVPYVAGFDFSPWVILVAIKVTSLFLSSSLPFYLL